ncbi:unnamed protein product [Musa hybrid cultivar]
MRTSCSYSDHPTPSHPSRFPIFERCLVLFFFKLAWHVDCSCLQRTSDTTLCMLRMLRT